MKKKLVSLLLVLAMSMTLCVPAFAKETNPAKISYAAADVLTEKITTYSTGTATVYEHDILNTATGNTIKIIIAEGKESRTITTYENGVLFDAFTQVYTDKVDQIRPAASPGFEDIDEMYMSSVGLWGTLYRNVYTYVRERSPLKFSKGDALALVLTGIAAVVSGNVVITEIVIAFGCSVAGKNLDYAINGAVLQECDENTFEVWATNASTNKLGLRTSRTYVYEVVEGYNAKERRNFRETVYSYTEGDTRTNREMMTDGILNVASGAMG